MKDKLTERSYIVGYIFSLSLTLAAFLLVWRYVDSDRQIFSEGFLFAWIAALALVQLFAQLVFFLHLGRESKPRWNLTVLTFAATIVIILVFGSLWIMANLNYRGGHGTSPQQTETYIIEDEGFQLHQ
ncbi:MAG: cytochrome o ubiquinol oxidase subunit IV [Candidatus Saccharimonadales bacterium]